MSDDRKNDGLLPDWNDLELDWLKPAEAPAPARPEPPAPEPRRTAITPERRSEPAPRPAPQPEPRPEPRPEARPAPAAPPPPRRREPEPEPEPYRAPRRRGRPGGKVGPLLIVLIVLLGGGMIFAAWQLGSMFLNYHRDRSAYDDLASHAIAELAEQYEEEDEDADAPGTAAAVRVKSEVPITVDWDYLRSINRNVVGWIYSEGTVINYPVVQVEDHTYYLTHGFDGNGNNAGTLFADKDSVAGITQSHYMIYGHNMKDESMFGTLKNYVDQSYFEKHPTMYFLTPSGSYRIDLFCARLTESYEENFPGYFSSLESFQSYLNACASSAFWVDYDLITTERQLFTLSTCTSAAGYEDPRLLVHGVMVPIQ